MPYLSAPSSLLPNHNTCAEEGRKEEERRGRKKVSSTPVVVGGLLTRGVGVFLCAGKTRGIYLPPPLQCVCPFLSQKKVTEEKKILVWKKHDVTLASSVAISLFFFNATLTQQEKKKKTSKSTGNWGHYYYLQHYQVCVCVRDM